MSFFHVSLDCTQMTRRRTSKTYRIALLHVPSISDHRIKLQVPRINYYVFHLFQYVRQRKNLRKIWMWGGCVGGGLRPSFFDWKSLQREKSRSVVFEFIHCVARSVVLSPSFFITEPLCSEKYPSAYFIAGSAVEYLVRQFWLQNRWALKTVRLCAVYCGVRSVVRSPSFFISSQLCSENWDLMRNLLRCAQCSS